MMSGNPYDILNAPIKKICLLVIIMIGCREVYNPPVQKNINQAYLVAEGNIAAGNDSTFIQLSRTTQIDTQNVLVPELNAVVTVQNSNGDNFFLNDEGNGKFAALLSLNTNYQYRLSIKTSDGKEYVSDYTPVLITPPIDSVFYSIDSKGMNIFVSAKDESHQLNYYRYSYVETWQHNSPFHSSLIYDVVIRNRRPDEHVDSCWTVAASPDINVVSTDNLSGSTVHKNQLVFIPHYSEKLSVVYSIIVSQYALTKDAYNFWYNLRQNTETIGSLFDPQPFTNTGNIHCISNPSEEVIGYISASSVSQKRIFIKHSDIEWPLQPLDCKDTIADPTVIDFNSFFGSGVYIPLEPVENSLTKVHAMPTECGSCLAHGGSTVKPSYMP